jgi:oligopeptide/dipeptide ABC transporter ATP-binding protein
MTAAPLLDVRELRTTFFAEAGEVAAVDGVSFCVEAGKTLGLVGESGCGKSVTALSIMRLVPSKAGRVAGGRVLFRGDDLLSLDANAMRRIRGDAISMIFQDPMTSLNPVFTIGEQIVEAIRLHRKIGAREAHDLAAHMLEKVRFADARSRLSTYPHELSGGMRQRVMIAMALSCNPALLIADEPTTALDVTIQAQVLELIGRLQDELGMALLLITHDLGVVSEQADEVAVMYSGRIVEQGEPDALFSRPLHPYTVGLLGSIPGAGQKRLAAIPGIVPNPAERPSGCRFRDRCPRAEEICAVIDPPMREYAPAHWAACHFAGREAA